MPKPEWGVKRTCLSCAARFYDLGRDPITCPACGAEFDVAALGKPRRIKAEKAAPAESAAAPSKEADLVDDDDVEVAAGEDDALSHSAEEDEAEPAAPVRKGGGEDSEEEDDLGSFDSSPLIEDDADDDFEGVPSPDESDDRV